MHNAPGQGQTTLWGLNFHTKIIFVTLVKMSYLSVFECMANYFGLLENMLTLSQTNA